MLILRNVDKTAHAEASVYYHHGDGTLLRLTDVTVMPPETQLAMSFDVQSFTDGYLLVMADSRAIEAHSDDRPVIIKYTKIFELTLTRRNGYTRTWWFNRPSLFDNLNELDNFRHAIRCLENGQPSLLQSLDYYTEMSDTLPQVGFGLSDGDLVDMDDTTYKYLEDPTTLDPHWVLVAARHDIMDFNDADDANEWS